MSQTKLIRVLFVCLGNICRSPMAEAVFRQLVKDAGLANRIDVESAGIGNWHVGQRPHWGTLDVLRRNQIDAGNKRARQLSRSDLSAFDYIVVMDEDNAADIEAMFGRRLPRLLEFAKQPVVSGQAVQLDVPDPYSLGNFDEVYQLVLAGCQGLLAYIRQKEGL